MIEFEARYKIRDVEAVIAHLERHGITVSGTKHIIDRWHVPESVHSQKQQDVWFDEEHGVAYRIRQTVQPDGTSTFVMDTKQLTDANNHDSFHEEVIMEGSEAEMVRFLEEKKYYNWLTLDKIRYYFTSTEGINISMDTVEGLKSELGIDTVLELEYEGEGTRAEALAHINALAEKLGLKPEDRFEKSLTVEAMRVLAKFR